MPSEVSSKSATVSQVGYSSTRAMTLQLAISRLIHLIRSTSLAVQVLDRKSLSQGSRIQMSFYWRVSRLPIINPWMANWSSVRVKGDSLLIMILQLAQELLEEQPITRLVHRQREFLDIMVSKVAKEETQICSITQSLQTTSWIASQIHLNTMKIEKLQTWWSIISRHYLHLFSKRMQKLILKMKIKLKTKIISKVRQDLNSLHKLKILWLLLKCLSLMLLWCYRISKIFWIQLRTKSSLKISKAFKAQIKCLWIES